VGFTRPVRLGPKSSTGSVAHIKSAVDPQSPAGPAGRGAILSIRGNNAFMLHRIADADRLGGDRTERAKSRDDRLSGKAMSVRNETRASDPKFKGG